MLLWKLEAALDLSFVYEEMSPMYSQKYERHPLIRLKLNSLHRSTSGLYGGYLAEKQYCQNCEDGVDTFLG